MLTPTIYLSRPPFLLIASTGWIDLFIQTSREGWSPPTPTITTTIPPSLPTGPLHW
ncbi:MAG TPA: hypothetical protein VFN35_06710 [Ktedonobacteraceae bacterium]|nr:hypothetical protein [Ktedonobacteraceae bacterium]